MIALCLSGWRDISRPGFLLSLKPRAEFMPLTAIMIMQGTLWQDRRRSILCFQRRSVILKCFTLPFWENDINIYHFHSWKFTGMCAPGYGNKLRRSKCMVFWGCKGGGGKRVDVYVPWTMQLSLCHLLSIPQCSFYNTKSQNKMKKKEMELNAYLLSWSIYLFFEKYFLNT